MHIDGKTTNFLATTAALGICLWLVTCASSMQNDAVSKAAETSERVTAPAAGPTREASPTPEPTIEDATAADGATADVVSVGVTGEPHAYTFSVNVESPDTGCDQYANWWEVITPEGELIYRRILLHPHENEQPFERSGGPVAIDADTTVIVRAHMHSGGYGGSVMRGSVEDGFTTVAGDPDFAADLADAPPTPEGCGF